MIVRGGAGCVDVVETEKTIFGADLGMSLPQMAVFTSFSSFDFN